MQTCSSGKFTSCEVLFGMIITESKYVAKCAVATVHAYGYNLATYYLAIIKYDST